MPATRQGCVICTFTLPSGRRCSGPALRGHSFCRHHVSCRRRILQDNIDVRLARYRRELDAMDLPRLFHALLEKLDRISAIIPAYPEAWLIVALASDRVGRMLSQVFDGSLSPHSATPDLALLTEEEMDKYVSNRLQQ